MVRPIDHITVLQQINFAEREHQNLQTHPELNWLLSSQLDKKKKEIERRRTQDSRPTERTKIHLDENREEGKRRGKRGKGKSQKGRNIDLEA